MHAHTHAARTHTHWTCTAHNKEQTEKKKQLSFLLFLHDSRSIYFEIIVNMLLRTSPRPGLQPPVTRGHARLACSPVRERVHCPARGRKAGRALRTQAFLWWPGQGECEIDHHYVRDYGGGVPGVCRHFPLHEQFTAQPRISCSWETKHAPVRNHV